MELHWFYKAWRIRAARDQKREKLRKSRKTFCVFDGNSDFYAKSWKFLKNHHFALSRNVGIPCRLLVVFQVARCFFK